MGVEYVIMAHPSRKEFVPKLQEAIKCPVVWDDKGLGLVKAHVQAWEAFNAIPGNYCCVIQDDVILTEDFRGKMSYHVLNCIEKYGRIGFHAYLRNTVNRHVLRKVGRCKREKKDHVVLPSVYSGNSIALPSEHVGPMLEHFKTMDVASGDRRINDYLHKAGLGVYFPLPSLVDHRELKSLHCGNASGPKLRKALYFES